MTCSILFCFQMSQAMNWSAEDCEKLQKARDEPRLEKKPPKKQWIYRNNRARHEKFWTTWSTLLLQVCDECGTSDWQLVASRLGDVSPEDCEAQWRPGRHSSESISEFEVFGVDALSKIVLHISSIYFIPCGVFLQVRNVYVSNASNNRAKLQQHWCPSPSLDAFRQEFRSIAELRKVQLNRHGAFDVWTTWTPLFIPPDIAHRM